jgi:hypothetical protein
MSTDHILLPIAIERDGDLVKKSRRDDAEDDDPAGCPEQVPDGSTC